MKYGNMARAIGDGQKVIATVIPPSDI